MRFSTFFLPLIATASAAEAPAAFMDASAPQRYLAANCPDYAKEYPGVENIQLVNTVCQYWPEENWGPFPEELVGNLVEIAKSGSLTKLIQECKDWMKANNDQDFCWRKVFQARPKAGYPASCDGPGMDHGEPTFAWKCWTDCDKFCLEKFGESGGYGAWWQVGTWCHCPVNGNYRRYADATCEGGEEPYFGSCYGTCPAGFKPNGVFKSKCATDCSQNKNGLTNSCGLGCSKDGYQCASSIFGMVASAVEAVIDVAAAASDDEKLAKASEDFGKMLEVTSNVVEKAMDSMSEFDNGDKDLGRMAVFGALMTNFAEDFKSENGGYAKGMHAYKTAVADMMDALKDGKDKYPDSAKDIITNVTGKFQDVAEDVSKVFHAYYHAYCE